MRGTYYGFPENYPYTTVEFVSFKNIDHGRRCDPLTAKAQTAFWPLFPDVFRSIPLNSVRKTNKKIKRGRKKYIASLRGLRNVTWGSNIRLLAVI